MRISVAGLRSLARIAGDTRRGQIRNAQTTEDQRPETRDRHPRLLTSIRCGLTTAVVIIGGSSSLVACPVCFGAEESSMIDGTKLGILELLAVTLCVQGAFAGFFFYLRKRAKRIADVDLATEWSELQRGPSRT